jgi:excisionase family DNA binding protein
MTDDVLTLSEAAARAGVHRRTVRAWIRSGRLAATFTPGGHYRIRAGDLATMSLSASEFARAVGVCHRTALRWAAAGKLDAERWQGAWRIAASEVERVGPRRRS